MSLINHNQSAVDTTDLSTQDKARLLMRNHQQNARNRRQALLSRAAEEVGL